MAASPKPKHTGPDLEVTNQQATDRIRAAIAALLVSKNVSAEIGPACSHFDASDGKRYEYQVATFGAEGEENLHLLYRALLGAFQVIPDGMKIIWRVSPEIVWRPKRKAHVRLMREARAAHWSGYVRFVAIPSVVIPLAEEEAA